MLRLFRLPAIDFILSASGGAFGPEGVRANPVGVSVQVFEGIRDHFGRRHRGDFISDEFRGQPERRVFEYPRDCGT